MSIAALDYLHHPGISTVLDPGRGVYFIDADEDYCATCMERLLEDLESQGLTLTEPDQLPEITSDGCVRLYLEEKGAA